ICVPAYATFATASGSPGRCSLSTISCVRSFCMSRTVFTRRQMSASRAFLQSGTRRESMRPPYPLQGAERTQSQVCKTRGHVPKVLVLVEEIVNVDDCAGEVRLLLAEAKGKLVDRLVELEHAEVVRYREDDLGVGDRHR